jgi:O-antigen/teichoic acid export membrane protein
VTIALAIIGFGAFSLAIGMVADRLAGFVLAIAQRRRLGGPVWPRFRAWGPVFRFGRLLAGTNVLEELRHSGTTLAVSHFLGFAAAGILSRAQRINRIVHQAIIEGIGPAMVPALAHHQRAGHDLQAAYVTKVSYLSAFVWPFALFTVAFAEPMVWLLLGPNWGDVVPLVRILAIIGIFAPFLNFIGKFYVVLDLLPTLWRRQLVANLGGFALLLGAALWSLEWVAWAIAGERALKAALTLGPIHRRLGCTVATILHAVKHSAMLTAAIGAGIGLLILGTGVPEAEDSVLLIVAVAITAAIWLGGLFAVRHPASTEIARICQWLRVPRGSASAPQ